MEYIYDDYQATKYFGEWIHTIIANMSTVELILAGAFIVISIYYIIKGNIKERLLLVGVSVTLTVLVLNPWSTWIMCRIFGDDFHHRLFRYFWLYPLYMVLAYFMTRMISKTMGKLRMVIIWVCFVCGGVIGCEQLVAGHYNTLNGHTDFKIVDNIYKISDDTVETADIIAESVNNPYKDAYVLYDRNIGMEIRAYNGSLIAAHGQEYGTQIMDMNTLSSYVAKRDWESILASVVSSNNMPGLIGTNLLRLALANTRTEYVIINSESYNIELLEETGLRCMGQSKSGKYLVYDVIGPIRCSDQDEPWQSRLYNPTQINKYGELYFINDCWQHRIIYNDNLETPLEEWKSLTENITGGHTLSSDGSIYVCDDTDNNGIRVYERDETGFTEVQNISDVCYRPHYTYYDETTGLFYVMGVNNGELLVYKNDNNRLTQIDHILFDRLIDSYTRSFSVIDGYMYIIGNHIYKVDYQNDYDIVEVYDIPEDIQGTIGLRKVQDYYYLTIYTDSDFKKNPGFIRTKDLSTIIKHEYEELYPQFGFIGTPYLMTEIDGRYFVTEADQSDGIVSFDIIDNEIVDIQRPYYSGQVNSDSILRYYSGYEGEAVENDE